MDINAEYLRRRKRSSNKNAVLTEETVARIKRLLLTGIPPQELAEANGVGTETIRRIKREETWGWVRPEGEGQTIPDEAIEASQERLLKLLQDEKPTEPPPADPVTRIIEEANQFLNPAGLDKFIGDGKG